MRRKERGSDMTAEQNRGGEEVESTRFNLIHFGNGNSQEHSFWQDLFYDWKTDSNHQFKVELLN